MYFFSEENKFIIQNQISIKENFELLIKIVSFQKFEEFKDEISLYKKGKKKKKREICKIKKVIIIKRSNK